MEVQEPQKEPIYNCFECGEPIQFAEGYIYEVEKDAILLCEPCHQSVVAFIEYKEKVSK